MVQRVAPPYWRVVGLRRSAGPRRARMQGSAQPFVLALSLVRVADLPTVPERR